MILIRLFVLLILSYVLVATPEPDDTRDLVQRERPTGRPPWAGGGGGSGGGPPPWIRNRIKASQKANKPSSGGQSSSKSQSGGGGSDSTSQKQSQSQSQSQAQSPPKGGSRGGSSGASEGSSSDQQGDGLQPAGSGGGGGGDGGDYMGIVGKWRSAMGLSSLSRDSKLQSNAQDTSSSSGGALKHKLNSGSMAQVMAPGNSGNFESVFVGGWLCEMPNLPGLGSSVCSSMTKGWNHAGQTGHAEILSSTKYKKIGCALAGGIWTCDLA